MAIPPFSGAPAPNPATDIAYGPQNILIWATAQRTATTPALNQVIWDTNLLTFYIGDGQTVGGNQSNTGLTDEVAITNNWIIPRHKNLAWRLQAAVKGGTTSNVFTTVCLGNSIMEGDGCTNPADMPPAQIATQLGAYTGIASSNWTVPSDAVGGSTSATTMAMIADNGDGSTSFPIRGTTFPSGSTPGCVLMLTIRNDANKIPLANWGGYIRSCLQMLRRRNIDVIFVIDPPSINITTGAPLDTQANWWPWYKLGLTIAQDEGASVVDVWNYWTWLQNHGVDLRTIYNDNLHPNNFGSIILSSLMFQCMTLTPRRAAQGWDRGIDITDGYNLVSTYNEVNGAALSNISAVSGGTLVGPTSRQRQNGESPAKCFQVTSGNTLFFAASAPYRACIVSCLAAPNATGTINVGILGGSSTALTGIVPLPVGGYQTTGGIVRQYDVRYEAAGALLNGVSTVTVQANGGTVFVLGVTFVTDIVTECHATWASGTEVGTWSSGSDTFYSGSPIACRYSSSIGDTYTVLWYGSSLSFCASTNSSAGKFTYTFDGGGSTTVDLYSASNLNLRNYSLHGGTGVAWHTIVITVATKNPSSSGNTVQFGGFRVTSCAQPTSFIDTNLQAGSETFNLTDYFARAIITSQSGSPTLPQWSSGLPTYALGGSGTGLVRFERSN